MPGVTLRLLLVLSLAAAALNAKPGPAAAAGQVKEIQTKSMMTKTTSPGRLRLKSSVQAGLQKDHLPYKCLWEKEEFVVLKNGREFDLESKMRASTYKKKKLLFQNIVLKLVLFRGKQINYAIRKEKVSPVLTKTKVSVLVRKPRHLEKQKSMKAKLQKELKNTPSRKIRLTAETSLQFVIVELNWLDRRWRWLKGAFLKAPLNTLASSLRNKQGIRGNVENHSKLQKKNGPGSRPLKPTRIVWQGRRTRKLYNLRMVYKELCKSMNSERVPSVKDEEEPEKDEIVLKTLQGNLGSLNNSANGGSTWKVQSRKIFFGCYRKKSRKGLPTSLTSMKTKSMIIQTQEFGNRVILSVTRCVHIGNDGSRDPCGRQTSAELRDIIHILSRNEGQEIKSLTANYIQEKLKLFKVTSKDKEHRVKIWFVYVRMPFRFHQRKANTFQRKMDRLVNQDGSQTDPRTPNRKPEVGPGAPELENDREASQQIRLEEGGGKNSRHNPSTALIHSQLCTFIITKYFNYTVMLQEKLSAVFEASVAQLSRKRQPGLTVISPKSSFQLKPQQVNSVTNLGKMRRLILNLWKTKQTISRVLPGNIKLRSKKPVQPNNHDVSVTSGYQKLLQDRESLSSDFLYFPGFAPSSELIKRQKRDASKNGKMVEVPADFMNHLTSLLGAGVGVVAVAFIILSVVIIILYFKRRKLFQVSKVTVVRRKYPDKSCRAIRDSCFHGVSLSRCFHSRGLKVLKPKESEFQEALQQKESELGFRMTSITSSNTTSNGESINLGQNSLSSSSSDSFFIQSLEASGDWHSDEEGSFYSSSLKGSLTERVQVYLETVNPTRNFKEFQCDVTPSEDENSPILGNINQHKMHVPKSTSHPCKAFYDSSLESRDDPFRASSASI